MTKKKSIQISDEIFPPFIVHTSNVPLPSTVSFPEDRCSICSFTFIYQVTALPLPLLQDLAALSSCQRRKNFLCCDKEMSLLYSCCFPQMHVILPDSKGMCIFTQSWKQISLDQPPDQACIHRLVLTHPPTQRLTEFWPDCIQLTWISHFLAKQFPSRARWPLPCGYIISMMP